jgi:hypothetical protein
MPSDQTSVIKNKGRGISVVFGIFLNAKGKTRIGNNNKRPNGII